MTMTQRNGLKLIWGTWMTKRIFLLCGIPGSGKSYWAEEMAVSLGSDAIIISRDKIRFSLLKNDDNYFSKENAVFAQFVKKINDCIANQIPYIFIDATHISIASRAKILKRLQIPAGTELSVEVFNTSLQTCLKRNNKRTGRALVPESAIKSMSHSFSEPTIKELSNYPFSKIQIFYHNEVIW